jgi:hypothetical protein
MGCLIEIIFVVLLILIFGSREDKKKIIHDVHTVWVEVKREWNDTTTSEVRK